MKVTLYKKPNGAKEILDVTKVYLSDAAWFEEHNAALSMEETGGTFVVYADVGLEDDDGEPMEAIELANGRSCEDTMQALRIQCEEMLKASAS